MGVNPSLALLTFCILGLNAQIRFENENSAQQNFSLAFQEMTAKLYLEESKISTKNNIVISPLSIHLAMSMLYYGLKGRSRKELRNALGLDLVKKRAHLEEASKVLDTYESLQDENITLSVANGLYVTNNSRVEPEYANLIRNQFDAEINFLDFTQKKVAADIINGWADNKTHGLIQNLVSDESIDRETKLLIVNAVYFKAKWLKPFDEKHTKRGKFMTLNNTEKNVDFMFLRENLESAFIEDLNSTVIAIPYADEDYKMIIIHPQESTNINNLETTLFNNSTSKGIESYLSKLGKKETDFFLPKFETGSDISLVKHFQAMGVNQIFREDAAFKAITNTTDVAVSDIIHKTKIEVNEEGSEAAAATAVIFTKVFTRKPKIRINSAFIFFIFDTKNKIPIFTGKIVDPVGATDLKNVQDEEENQQFEPSE